MKIRSRSPAAEPVSTDPDGRHAELERELAATQARYERADKKRAELDTLLRRLVDSESDRARKLEEGERQLERREAESKQHQDELEQRLGASEKERAQLGARIEALEADASRAKEELGHVEKRLAETEQQATAAAEQAEGQ